MGKQQIEGGTPKPIRLNVRERGIPLDERGNDSGVRYSRTEERDHESLTLKPIYRAVNINGLKLFAAESLPGNSRLRDVLLSERDQLTANDFLAKMDVWMRLLNIEKTDLLI
jgi:hypothetical protein